MCKLMVLIMSYLCLIYIKYISNCISITCPICPICLIKKENGKNTIWKFYNEISKSCEKKCVAIKVIGQIGQIGRMLIING